MAKLLEKTKYDSLDIKKLPVTIKVENINPHPSAFEELNILSNINKTKTKLSAVLERFGYKHYKYVDVPGTRCFFYLPKCFPTDKEKAVEFDFEAYRYERLTFGVCFGGPVCFAGLKQTLFLTTQGFLDISNNKQKALEAIDFVNTAVENFRIEFPQLKQKKIKLDVRVCGYSLGGLYAQAYTMHSKVWAETTESAVRCRTYESCGVPESLQEEFCEVSLDPSYYQKRIVNYKTFPNPVNTLYSDFGKVYHLMNIDSIISDGAWICKCMLGFSKRVAVIGTAGAGAGVVGKCATVAIIARSLLFTLSTTLVAELHLSVSEMHATHDIKTMLACYDKEGIRKHSQLYEMESWPKLTRYENFQRKISQFFLGLVPLIIENPGLTTMHFNGGKKEFYERALLKFPGYQRRHDI